MGKIILNDIEYGIGISNGVNVDTTNLVKKDNIVTVIDENVTDEQIPSAKAVHTVIQNVSGGVSTEQLEEAIEEAKTDLEEEFHTAMGKKMDVITSYLNSPSGDLLDTTVAPLVLCALSATNNAGLYKIMNDTFAYVITNFYMSMTPTSKRFQLAIGYTKDKMAFRRYTTEWSAWTEIASTTKLQSEINSFLTNKLTDYPTLEYLEDVKTELENEITNIPKVTKTSELTNDSGFITINDIPEIDIPEVDLEPYALKTQIPTTLPASDVYDWAKEATKPTYTASEVGALASNGTAKNASKVANNLTLQIGGTTKNTFNGSSAQTFNIPNATTSTSGVMTKDMVTKLDSIATGANNYTHPSTHEASMITGLHTCATTGNADSANKVSNALTISLNGTSQGAYDGSAVKNINITAESVGALASNGTATNASKVSNALTLQIGGTTKNTFNGSSAQTFNIPNASTSTAGVMTTAQVTTLNTHTTEIDNLKNTVVDGKTSVANAINGKLGTTLSNQTSFADMAYYINTIPSMASVGSLPNNSEFIQINLPVKKKVLGGNTLAKGKTVTIDGGLIMFVCDDDRESLRITPINAPIKVYGRADTTKTVNAGTSFSTDGYEWFIVNPSRTQLSCIRVGLSDADKWNPAINISIS